MHVKWTKDGLVAWLSWVDDYLVIGPKHEVKKANEEMMDRFDCDEVGEVREYVGCIEGSFVTASCRNCNH
jgi:hypothetical protein